jgi:hypothetical protein
MSLLYEKSKVKKEMKENEKMLGITNRKKLLFKISLKLNKLLIMCFYGFLFSRDLNLASRHSGT